MIRFLFSSRASAFLLILMAVLVGCASSNRFAEVPLQSPYETSRHGALRYKVPVGWFDATNDPQSAAAEIWLVRNDYAATISVSEIDLDKQLYPEISRGGFERLANLSFSLVSAGGSAVMISTPEPFFVEGRRASSYTALTSGSNDTLRVVISSWGDKIFEVVALVAGSQGRVSSEEVFSAQLSFVKALR